MSISDSDGEYKTLRQISRDRLVYEMLQTSQSGDSTPSPKVLIMDKFTVKVMSNSCQMSDIIDQGVLLVEDLYKRRQPIPSADAIYFIQPSKLNVVLFMSDMSGRKPLYRKAYVYFSSPVSEDLISRIKKDISVLPRIGALKEMNLEYLAIDNQGFITDHEEALEELFGEDAENSVRSDAYLNLIATRIATVFASLEEFPFVRYRAAKGLKGATMMTSRDLVPNKLAAAVWNSITKYKSSIPNFPQTETCELLIVDRSIDQIAPIIHEWTYDAMCHELLNLDGNKYVQEVPRKSGGKSESEVVRLDDHDPIWLELRHAHIAEASGRLHDKLTNFVSVNKAAQLPQRDGSDPSTRDIRELVRALPQYEEQMEKLPSHIEIAEKLNKTIKEMDLKELGQLEQDLVFGDAGRDEVINFLRMKQELTNENKLRLVMIYASVFPEKFEADKEELMQLAKLSDDDMQAVKNMKLFEGSDTRKEKHALREARTGEEVTWDLFWFNPTIEELIGKLSRGELPKDEYHCMNSPNGALEDVYSQSTVPHSSRSRSTAEWAKSRSSSDGYSSDSVSGTASCKNMGQRIFVFIIGGATRSELRVCHKLTAKLRREVVLGSTSIDDPSPYIKKLKYLSTKKSSQFMT